jgi:hypothetical protein
VAAQDEYKMEFSIISVQRSFTLHGSTLEERDDWVTALNAAIEENALKRNTFEAVRAGAQVCLYTLCILKSWLYRSMFMNCLIKIYFIFVFRIFLLVFLLTQIHLL